MNCSLCSEDKSNKHFYYNKKRDIYEKQCKECIRKKHRKKYVTPKKPWDKVRLEREAQLVIKYGLRNKRELWRFENILRKYRRVARDLLGKINLPGKEGEYAKAKAQMVIRKLYRMGVLPENATLDDILNLSVEDFLERRLQTVVYRQGLANTIKQAR